MSNMKKILIISAIVISLGVGTYLTVKSFSKPDDGDNGGGSDNGSNNNTTTKKTNPSTSGNTSTELSNSPIGKTAYTISANTNLRSSAKVDNGYVDNNVGKIEKANTKIGVITEAVEGIENKLPVWYKIKLDNPVSEYFIKYEYAFVRSDVVTIK